jgi:hypothetical protein
MLRGCAAHAPWERWTSLSAHRCSRARTHSVLDPAEPRTCCHRTWTSNPRHPFNEVPWGSVEVLKRGGTPTNCKCIVWPVPKSAPAQIDDGLRRRSSSYCSQWRFGCRIHEFRCDSVPHSSLQYSARNSVNARDGQYGRMHARSWSMQSVRGYRRVLLAFARLTSATR